ncbi:hypothetical protein EVAR_65574_1 [Eumeta japonica]|uniref:Uncharacterized protein n=1 Tax=Eumeta variegata TaxID=151549 RepID=A0A4C1Z9W4_EUMVA|nr:hypothetical protein EVAR_65574_1 [Eumeta japonica]
MEAKGTTPVKYIAFYGRAASAPIDKQTEAAVARLRSWRGRACAALGSEFIHLSVRRTPSANRYRALFLHCQYNVWPVCADSISMRCRPRGVHRPKADNRRL